MTPDLRLRDIVRHSLAAYRTGASSLRQLVDDLDTVWSSIQPSDWRVEFRGHWWTLEQIYSVALDRGELDLLSNDSLRAVDEAVTALERLVDSWPGEEPL
jgi:hypothetical protein